MKKVLVSVVAVLAIAAVAQATLTYSTTSAPTTPGGAFPPPVPCTTYQLTLTEDNGMWPTGVTIDIGDGVTLVNQVNPMAAVTIFADNNFLITGLGGFLDQDSQFPYISVAGATQQVVPAGIPVESATQLFGNWALFGGTAAPNVVAGPSLLVAQVVIPTGASVPFSATVVEYDPGTNAWAATLNISGVIPEPATMALLTIGGLGVLLRRKR